MANLPLYAMNPGVGSRWAKFPEDLHVIDWTLVDDHLVDHPEVGGKIWFRKGRTGKGCDYAKRNSTVDGKRKAIRLHRVVWEIANGPIPDGMEIDHINRNGLDNRLDNLRLATRQQQNKNKSKRKNSPHPAIGIRKRTKYGWYVRTNECHIGKFDTIEKAAFAYDVAVSHFFGEFAALNNMSNNLTQSEKQQIEREVLERIAAYNHA